MKIPDINLFFSKLSRFQVRYRAVILLVMTAFTIFCLTGLTKLRIVSDDGIVKNEENIAAEKRFTDIFTSNSLLILVTADDVFSPEVLQAIDEIGSRLEKELTAVDSVYSLLTMPIPIGSEDGIKISNPFKERGGIPQNPEELEEIKKFFLSRESLVNQFYSDDAKETWVLVSLRDIEDESLNREMQAQKIILEEAEKYKEVCRMNPIGNKYYNMECRVFARKEAIIRILIGCVVVLIIFFLLLHSVRAVLVSILVTVFGISSVFGFSSHLGFPLNIEAVSLPVLLGMALAVGYSIHIINSFKLHFRRSGKRKEAVYAAVEETGWPILFTVTTTITAFVSFLLFDATILHWIGIMSTGVIFSVYLYVIILIPVVMSFGKDESPDSSADEKGFTKVDKIFGSLGNIIIDKKIFVSIISSVIILIMIPGIFKITVNLNLMDMQGKKVPHIARIMEIMDHKLGNLYSYNLMIDFDDPNAFKDTKQILKLEELQEKAGHLRLVQKSGGKPRVRSACDSLKEINKMFNNDDPSFYTINTDEGVIAQNLMIFGNLFEHYFDVENDDFGVTRLQIDITDFDFKKLVKDADEIKACAEELFPDAKVYVIGTTIKYARASEIIVRIELKSILWSLFFIAIMLIITFGSVKTGLIAMIPNIAPIIILAGIIGYMEQPLDTLTVTIMPMILGLAVDDTIHLTNHIRNQFRMTGNYKKAISLSLQEIGKTMFMTSIILCTMFAVYLTSPMNFFVHTGLFSIIGVFSALVADYTLTPALLCLFKAFGKEKKE
ncbi:MAG: MMPL family transporter [Treponema sp.]|nr:MMPL family transporter [Treponema sp.]